MPQSVQSFWVRVTRPQDLLEIIFEFRNVGLDMPKGNKPGRIASVGGSRLVVYFTSQHVAEQAIFETLGGFQPTEDEKKANPEYKKKYSPDPKAPINPGEIGAIFSGPSRLVFDIPRGEEIPYTLSGLLEALKRLPLVVSPLMTYQPPGCNPLYLFNPTLRPREPRIIKPGDDITAIEIPYRLIMSPDDTASWEHASGLVTVDGRTELWHTKLRPADDGQLPDMRAIWTPDFQAGKHVAHENKPFRMSLDAHDRNELVHLTSNWYLTQGNYGYHPEPVDTDQLMLSTLGGWLKVYGAWPVRKKIRFPAGDQGQEKGIMTVEEWRHEATMSRDQYVRVVYAGYLYPFGHEASLVKITERKFYYREDPPGYVAYLFQRMFIIVRQRVRRYTHRESPFRRIVVKTRRTPNLDPPADSQIFEPKPGSVWPKGSGQEAFWPMVTEPGGPVPFPFKMSAEDWEGRTLEFTSPAVFVTIDTDDSQAKRNLVYDAYNFTDLKTVDRRRRPFDGQMVAYAPPSKPKNGDTSLSTRTLTFGALKQESAMPHFLPGMTAAEVEVPAVARLLGNSKPVEITFEETYTTASKAKPELSTIGNKGEVFARLRGAPADLKFQVDKGGGLAAPDIKISGLSRSLGPVDITEYNWASSGETEVKRSLINGAFHAGMIFPDVKLLGGIPLKSIISNRVNFGHASQVDGQIPGLNSVVVSENGVDIARTTYRYELGLSGLQQTDLFVPEEKTRFSIVSEVDTPLNGDPGTFDLKGELTNFSVILVPEEKKRFVEIMFERLSFNAVKDKKPDVSVDLKGVKFLGPLEFINTLSDVIPLDGFSDPPNLAVTPSGVELGYSLGLPAVGVGIFSLQNVSLSAGAFLPLITDKELNFRFAFCERHQPFLLTVSLFGGGGFFGLDLGIGTVKMIEAALEFGAAAAVNLGVAAGTLSFMGGVYYQKAGDSFELTGYLRATGALSVLGLITVTVEFYLGLSYSSKSNPEHKGAVWGRAELTVKIEIAFFSKSVGIPMEREFAGADPVFYELVTPSDWQLYCEAFADYQ